MTTAQVEQATKANALRHRVKAAYLALGYPQLTNVDCEIDGSTTHLTGSLGSFHLKQLAQAIAIKVPGVLKVDNKIEVEA